MQVKKKAVGAISVTLRPGRFSECDMCRKIGRVAVVDVPGCFVLWACDDCCGKLAKAIEKIEFPKDEEGEDDD